MSLVAIEIIKARQAKRAVDEFWREWRKRLHRELGAMLAETIGVTPSTDENVRATVNAAIALEQETVP